MKRIRINKAAFLLKADGTVNKLTDYLFESIGIIHEQNLYELLNDENKSKILIPEIYLETLYNQNLFVSVMLFIKENINEEEQVNLFEEIKSKIDGKYGEDFKNQVFYLAKEPFTIGFEKDNFEIINV